MAKNLIIIALLIVCLFQWLALNEGNPKLVFNTQPVWVMMSPRLKPIIEFTDLDTVVLHRPPEKWFTVSCIEWGATFMRPNYHDKNCWPTTDDPHKSIGH